jgi:5'-nucleotidase
MTKRICLGLSVVCVVSAGGCASHKKADKAIPMDRGVTDIAPTRGRQGHGLPPDPSFVSVPASSSQPRFIPVDAQATMPAHSMTPAYTPGYSPGVTPAAEPSPMVTATPAPVAPAPAAVQVGAALPASPSPSAGGRQYKVQKGDTLFRIAKTHYGDGNRWQQIASANPGVTPATLRAGSTIVVP